jgi:hypothetical protein
MLRRIFDLLNALISDINAFSHLPVLELGSYQFLLNGGNSIISLPLQALKNLP